MPDNSTTTQSPAEDGLMVTIPRMLGELKNTLFGGFNEEARGDKAQAIEAGNKAFYGTGADQLAKIDCAVAPKNAREQHAYMQACDITTGRRL